MGFIHGIYLGIALLLAYLITSFRVAFKKGLRNVPGPIIARFSGLYSFMLLWKGESSEEYRQLHLDYGQVVRVGPNHVSVSDPAMIPVIYGIGSKFLKVGLCCTGLGQQCLHRIDCFLFHHDTFIPGRTIGKPIFNA